jgi:thymidylate kinase
MIVLMAGLPGTGKSTLSRRLAAECDGVVLDKDEIRAALFPPAYVEYSAGQDDFCQLRMLDTAAYLLERHPGLRIFLDGRTFSRAYQIRNAIAEDTARRRIEASRASHPALNRTYELYRKLQAEFEPIPPPKLVIDTGEPLDKCIDTARPYLLTDRH